MRRFSVRPGLLTAVAAMLIATAAAGGCRQASPSASRSGDLVNTEVLAEIAPTARPDDPDLSTPKKSVQSYTDWISYAYRVLNSDVATMAFGPNEEVHVNSYIQYNIQQDRGLEQSLQRSNYKVASASATTAVVVGDEYWLYRYFALDGSHYLTEPTDASYEITYTVLRQPDGRWLVDKVRANRLDPVIPPEGSAKPDSK